MKLRDATQQRQLTLFSDRWPDWQSLPQATQESVVNGLAQILLQKLQQHIDRVTVENSTSNIQGES